jgi:hypothetical protein
MGNRRTQNLCVRLHAQAGYWEVYQDSASYTPDGVALIDECVTEAREEGQAYLTRCLRANIR